MFKINYKLIIYSFIILFVLLMCLTPLTFLYLKGAWALIGDYSKTPEGGANDQLVVGDWNDLDEDFVLKEGDTMTGPMILPAYVGGEPDEYAVTKEYVDLFPGATEIRNNIGLPLSMYCAVNLSTLWYATVNSCELTIDVHVTDDGTATGNLLFSNTPTPFYLTSITGNTHMYNIIKGENVIRPTTTGFTLTVKTCEPAVYVNKCSAPNAYCWRVQWCGVGVSN